MEEPFLTQVREARLRLDVRLVIFSLHNNQLHALLMPSASPLFAGKYELPGDEVTASDSLQEKAQRCLIDFIGPSEAYLEQLYTYGDPHRHPTSRLISVVYYALIPMNIWPDASRQPRRGQWFAINDLPELAMDHSEILQYALRRLRYKLEYSAVGFELLPRHFTLSELQHTYEIILGEKLDKRNFRRRILAAGIIEPTNSYRGGEGRPARLYRYNPDVIAEVKARRLFP